MAKVVRNLNIIILVILLLGSKVASTVSRSIPKIASPSSPVPFLAPAPAPDLHYDIGILNVLENYIIPSVMLVVWIFLVLLLAIYITPWLILLVFLTSLAIYFY